MLILEVNPFASEHLHSHFDIVDLLQAADGWQTELGRQAPVLGEELHHAAGSKPHMKNTLEKELDRQYASYEELNDCTSVPSVTKKHF